MRRKGFQIALFAVCSFLLMVLDRVVKIATLEHFEVNGGEDIDFGLFTFTFVKNQGAAFGVGQGQQPFFILMAVFICCLIVWMVFSGEPTALQLLACILVVPGAVGNAVDRFEYNYVIDMINVNFIDFPVFNVADICITVGVVLLVLAVVLRPGSKAAPQEA